jgi:hypothetical protein
MGGGATGPWRRRASNSRRTVTGYEGPLVGGRHLTGDGIGGLYAYAGNDPINFADPSGLTKGPLGGNANPAYSLLAVGATAVCAAAEPCGAIELGGVAIVAGVAIILNNQTQGDQSAAPPSTPSSIAPRPDLPPLSGGRSGQNVPGLTGPPNSAIPGGGNDRIFITDDNGNVVVDVTRDRAKPVIPGQGFGPKRAPTPQELDLLDKMGR